MAITIKGFFKVFGGHIRVRGNMLFGTGRNGAGAGLITSEGVPTDGTSGTGVGFAGPGSLCVDITNGQTYRNVGTKASPTWVPATGLVVEERTFTENGAGTYTGSVSIPAGATLVDVLVHSVALWNAGTSAVMKVGDATDDDGIFTGIDLKATDLLAGESLSLYQAGGKQGADLGDAATPGTQMSRRYLSTARVVSGIVTSVGAGTLGRTRLVVVYALPKTVAATQV